MLYNHNLYKPQYLVQKMMNNNSLDYLMKNLNMATKSTAVEDSGNAMEITKHIIEEWNAAEGIKAMNARNHIAWTPKDPKVVIFFHNLQAKHQKTKEISLGESHFSERPLSELKPITLRQMKVPFVHRGSFLPCRVVTEPYSLLGTTAIVEDQNNDVERILIYNFSEDLDDVGWLKQGAILIIKEPHMKYENDEHPAIRLDSPSDVVFVHPTNKGLLLALVDASFYWFEPERLNFDDLKKLGNGQFRQKNYRDALESYERALRLTTHPLSIALMQNNIAATLLELGRFNAAEKYAKQALHGGANKVKALCRLGKAAYGMRRWTEAVDHFQSALNECPPEWGAIITQLINQLQRAKTRVKEAETGEYDMKAVKKAYKKGECFFDLADYVVPVRVVQIPGKDKGIVTTKSVPQGTLLMACKAYAMSSNKANKPIELICRNLITNTIELYAQYHCKVKAVQRLAREPETAPELYALYAGANYDRNKPVPDGVVDVGRIERICTLNALETVEFNATTTLQKPRGQQQMQASSTSSILTRSAPFVQPDSCALWLLPSFMNHSCLENVRRQIYGDMMFVYAAQNLEKGEELKVSYKKGLFAMAYEDRKKEMKNWGGFDECDCELCSLDRNGAIDEQTKELQRQKMLMRQYAKNPAK